MEMPELPEQCALRLGGARVEFPQLGVEQIVKKERAVLGPVGGLYVGIKPAPLLCFLTRHKRPADRLRIAEDSGLDGFVFSGRYRSTCARVMSGIAFLSGENQLIHSLKFW